MKFVQKDPVNNMRAFFPLASMSFKCIYLKSMITDKIYTEMSLQGNLSFYECPHTCLIDIAWVCLYKHNLFILIYISRRMKFIHTPDNTHGHACTYFILLRFTHICIFQHCRNKDIYYHYHLRTHCGRLTHTCQESNLAFIMIMTCHLIGTESFFK